MSRLSAAAISTPALPERCQRRSCLAGAADEADENEAEPPCQRMDSRRQPASSSLQELHGGCSRADGLPSHPASSPKRPGAAAQAPVEVLPAVRRRCSSSVSRSRHHVVRRRHATSGCSGLRDVSTGRHAAGAPASPLWRRPGARRRAAAMLKGRQRAFGTKEIHAPRLIVAAGSLMRMTALSEPLLDPTRRPSSWRPRIALGVALAAPGAIALAALLGSTLSRTSQSTTRLDVLATLQPSTVIGFASERRRRVEGQPQMYVQYWPLCSDPSWNQTSPLLCT